MSFLVDPPLLVGTGAALGRLLPPGKAQDVAAKAVLATFIGTSVGLYLNRERTRWLWELCRAESGRDWMLNSGVTHFEHEHPKPWVHVVAAGIFATYPAWYRLGRRLGQGAR